MYFRCAQNIYETPCIFVNIVHFIYVVHGTQGGRVARKRQARAEQILEIAERLIAEAGVEAFSLHAVARELNVVAGTLYRYFPNKDALVAALHHRAILDLHQRYQAFSAQIAPGLESPAQPLCASELVLAELCAASHFYLELPKLLPNRFRFVSLMLGDPRNLIRTEDVPRSAVPLLAFLGAVRERFERAEASGALAPATHAGARPLDRTLIFWSAHQGVIQLMKLQRYEADVFDYVRLGRELTHPLLLGWGADPTALAKASARAQAVTATLVRAS